MRAAGHAFGIADLEAVIVQPHLPKQERLWRVAVRGGAYAGGLQAGGVPRRAVASPHEGLVGFDWSAPPATRAEVEAHLALKLAGRTAEEVILGEVSAQGPLSDTAAAKVARACRISERYISERTCQLGRS